MYGIKTIYQEAGDPKPKVENEHDFYESLDDAIKELKREHESCKQHWHQLESEELVIDGVKSFSDLKFGELHKSFVHDEDSGRGFIIREIHNVNQKETHYRHEVFEKADDVELRKVKDEFIKIVRELLKDSDYSVGLVISTYQSALRHMREPNYQLHIYPKDQRNPRFIDTQVVFYKLPKCDAIFVKVEHDFRSVPLLRDEMQQSTTWYERLPQRHFNYLWTENQKQKVVEVLKKKLKLN